MRGITPTIKRGADYTELLMEGRSVPWEEIIYGRHFA